MWCRRIGRFALVVGTLGLAIGCGGSKPPATAVQAGPAEDAGLADSIPPKQLAAVLAAHYRGLGFMERYEYAKAAEACREVRRLAPGWTPGMINLAIAMLNQGGAALVEAKKLGGEDAVAQSNLDAAVEILDGVIAAHPENPTAHYCRGLVLQQRGDIAAAHADFRKVAEIDPTDPDAWLQVGETLHDPDTGAKASMDRAPELIELYSRAIRLNPYLITATYRLAFAYRFNNQPDRQLELLNQFLGQKRADHPGSSGEEFALSYGEAGKYARVIEPFGRAAKSPAGLRPPRYGLPASPGFVLPDGHRWADVADLAGSGAIFGRARLRFGVGLAAFDADGDGDRDLYLTASVVGPKGLRDALFVNDGGRFRDVSTAWGLPEDRAGLGVAAGDFDADRRIDLFVSGIGDHRLFRNAGGRFEDRTDALGGRGKDAISPAARWLDIDQDGDLDLYVVNYCAVAAADRAFTDDEPPGVPNVAHRNDGSPAPLATPTPTWVPVGTATPEANATEGLSVAFSDGFAAAIAGEPGRHTSVAALDLDEDRDIDLVLGRSDGPAETLLNDRYGIFRPVATTAEGAGGIAAADGLLVLDLDKDGRPDVAANLAGGRVAAYRNASERGDAGPRIAWSPFPIDAAGWRAAAAIDVDLDTTTDLVGLPGPGTGIPLGWARGGGVRLESGPLPLPPAGDVGRPWSGIAMADVVGDALPDAIAVRTGETPRIYPGLGNGNRWVALDLGGRWKTSFDHMRTNPQAIGTRLALEGPGLYAPFDLTTIEAGPSQSVGPIVLGLGNRAEAPLLRLRWPDGVIQCELNVVGDKTLTLAENSRKTGSCPVLFTWNGARFECVGDFLGAAGLGFYHGPGAVVRPDRDEAIAIAGDQLRPVDGMYRIAVAEPMDEVAYLDRLRLDVVDRPPGSSVGLDERFATGATRPSGGLFAYSRTIEPGAATDHAGRDALDLVRRLDRRTVDGFARLGGWPGYTEPHALTLDFGDRLAGLGAGVDARLCLDGWAEYPYSQTNYAAGSAGVAYRTPTLERRRPDGAWEMVEADLGFPAGLPRMMSVRLDPAWLQGACAFRIASNMECYWDRAFVAVVDPAIRPQVSTLPIARAALGDRGYLRESSPDGRMPRLYEYDQVDPAPLFRPAGRLTRYGDVAELLAGDDDRLCTVGPGDEARIEFDGRNLPPPPEGWSRSFVLRAEGYCKDADPYTATGDAVGPLPWKGMGAYPFGTGGGRPADAGYDRYLEKYQTRPAGGR